MNKILSKLLNLLKYVLFLAGFALVFLGIILTYKRLEKNLVDSIGIFIPFILMLILLIINMFARKAKISSNLLFNFVSCIVFAVIIIIGVRAKFDVGMVLHYKYGIDYNPQYLSTNLSSIKIMLYCLGGCNALLLISSLFDKKEDKVDKEVTVEEKIEPVPAPKPVVEQVEPASVPEPVELPKSNFEPEEDFELVREPVTKLNSVSEEKSVEEL